MNIPKICWNAKPHTSDKLELLAETATNLGTDIGIMQETRPTHNEVTRALNQMHGNGCTETSSAEIKLLTLDENEVTRICSLISRLTPT